MQATRRRPLGDIGNTLGSNINGKLKTNELPKPSHVRAPISSSVVSNVMSPKADEKHRQNPLHAIDYVKDIHEYFRRTEGKTRPSPTYMARIQTDVNEKMRTMLIDWLVDVHLKFKLLPETLFLAVDIIDRFLDKKVVNRQKLQLVGVVGMLLAAKYEEIYPPEVKDFIYIAANTYTRDDILRMERLIFQTLDFNLTFPTVYVFLRRYLQVVDADVKTGQLAQYFAELCLADFQMLKFAPSLVASSCIQLANQVFGREGWSSTLEHYALYKPSELEICTSDLKVLVRNTPTQRTQAIRKKYSYAKYGEVSKLAAIESVAH